MLISSSRIDLLRSSLWLSKALHRLVIACGISLIEKQAIRTLRSFRLVVLKDVPDLDKFTHPAMLTRLALWLIDALRDTIVEAESMRTAAKQLTKHSDKCGDNLEPMPSLGTWRHAGTWKTSARWMCKGLEALHT